MADGEQVMRQEIGAPGVYRMPEVVYHADPAPAADGGSLSSTGARKILPPKTPAHFAYWREHGDPPKESLELGKAAHVHVLTEGCAVKVLDYPDWKTKDSRSERDAARAAGQVPILTKHKATVEAMAAAVRDHPFARALLAPGRGSTEQSLFWRHPRTNRWCRGRVDHLPATGTGRYYVLSDYKTSTDASTEAFGKTAARFGYHQQDPWYRDGVRALGIDPDPRFVFIVQETSPPYLVNVVELDDDALHLGRIKNDQAATLFDRCTTSGRWPGYGDRVDIATLPAWELRREGVNP